MHEHFYENLRPLRHGLGLALLALLFGFGMGIVFGAAEDSIKAGLEEDGRAALQSHYGGDEAAMKKVTSKAWSYMKRAHLHAGGMGAAALGLILLLSFLGHPTRGKSMIAIFIGIGALAYPVFWMLAAFAAPGMGSTGAAKESLAWLALPSSSLFVIGAVATTGILGFYAFIRRPPSE
jgi:hypothetical protein